MALSTEELNRKAICFKANPTYSERQALDALKAAYPGAWKFQRVCGFFILDFFFPERCLVVEIDGKIHDKQALYDARRDAFMNQIGLKVLRLKACDAPFIVDHINHYPLVPDFIKRNKAAWKMATERRNDYLKSVCDRMGQGKNGPDYKSAHMKKVDESAPYKHF